MDRRRRTGLVEPGKKCRQLGPTPPAQLLERGISCPDEGSQRARERGVRQLALALLDGIAAQHEHVTLGEQSFKLSDQACLANPGVTAEQQQCRLPVPGSLRWPLERLQLRAPPYEPIADQPARHARSIARSPPGRNGANGRRPCG